MRNFLQKIKLIIPAAITLIIPSSARAVNVDISQWRLKPSLIHTEKQLPQIITNGINIFLGIVGILVLVYLVYGGVLYITSAGDAEKAASGKNAVIHAIIGIVIIVAAYIIFSYAQGVTTGVKEGI